MKNIRPRTLGFILIGIGCALIAASVYELAQTADVSVASQ